MKVKRESEVAQSCPTLSDPMDCRPPGSCVHGIFQARVLEWVTIAFSPRIHEDYQCYFLEVPSNFKATNEKKLCVSKHFLNNICFILYIDLEQWFSKFVLCIPGGLETQALKGVLQGQNYCHLNMQSFLPFHGVDLCTDGTKAIVSEASGPLV